jgi:hypothetical protein
MVLKISEKFLAFFFCSDIVLSIQIFRSEMSSRRRREHLEAFGIFSCGMISCAILGGPFMMRLELIPSAGAITPMSYESMVTIMLAVATLVVGVILPLSAIFAFVLLREDLRSKAKDIIKKEIEEGRFQKQVDDAISPLLKNAKTVLDARIEEALKSKSSSPITDWGVEEDEYGELPPSSQRKLPPTKRRKRT